MFYNGKFRQIPPRSCRQGRWSFDSVFPWYTKSKVNPNRVVIMIIFFEQVIAIWLVGFHLTFDVHKKAWTFTLLNPHYTVIMALAFRIVVNKKKAVTYCQQALL